MRSDKVKKNVKYSAPSVASFQIATRSAVKDNVHSENFIIFGVENYDGHNFGFENSVDFASRICLVNTDSVVVMKRK